MDRTSIVFVILSVAAMIGLSFWTFPYAALSAEQIAAARTPQDAALFDDFEIGEFGTVSVLDMVQHYMDNPPVRPSGTSAPEKTRFQGC